MFDPIEDDAQTATDEWTRFWHWARTCGFRSREDIEDFIGKSSRDLSAEQLYDELGWAYATIPHRQGDYLLPSRPRTAESSGMTEWGRARTFIVAHWMKLVAPLVIGASAIYLASQPPGFRLRPPGECVVGAWQDLRPDRGGGGGVEYDDDCVLAWKTELTQTAIRVKLTGTPVLPVRGRCPERYVIKGNRTTTSGEWIYHVPAGQYYTATEPEECFASEADARAAGYRRSQR